MQLGLISEVGVLCVKEGFTVTASIQRAWEVLWASVLSLYKTVGKCSFI